jgi:ketosteroid isomerase-like protein
MTTATTQSPDEARIRQLIADEASAICAKDVDRIMARYALDVVIFNVKPSLQTRGADGRSCMGIAPSPFNPETPKAVFTLAP